MTMQTPRKLQETITNYRKPQGSVLAHTLYSIFFSIMLCEAKEDLQDSIHSHFLRHLLTCMKTIEELITKLLFDDDCALLAQSPSCFRCSCAGLATSQGWKTFACPKKSSSVSSKKESTNVMLQKSITKTS